ncbi:RNA polymerase sigma factor [Parapedobacter koreensis]|uniref:RNA polymerase sigma-70 factor, ECF subfamily n=1 Tax=Parapedobacter koreensis TaxID=332977 RepID=A0A1H7FPX6_9SPHI|nr:sigma-70 family RNA polymerase sigma factor [Parapedobacter koreensis]SEK28018.1 RNA polymerase sigma-70 factor, ECF subfamily [Parapedobacter koreensis]
MRIKAAITESELLTGIRNDVPGMFEELFNTHWEALYRQAYHRLHDQSGAEDLVQDIFTDIWERRHSLVITTSFQAYLRAALKYHLIKRASKADLQQKAMEHLLHRMETIEVSVMDIMAAGEISRTLNEAVQRFPENMRRIFLMRAEDFTVAEIATALGLSEQTVKNNTTDALRRLRVVLAQKHPDIPPSFYLVLLFILS